MGHQPIPHKLAMAFTALALAHYVLVWHLFAQEHTSMVLQAMLGQ